MLPAPFAPLSPARRASGPRWEAEVSCLSFRPAGEGTYGAGALWAGRAPGDGTGQDRGTRWEDRGLWAAGRCGVAVRPADGGELGTAACGLSYGAGWVGRRAVPSQSKVIQHPPGAEEFTVALGQP